MVIDSGPCYIYEDIVEARAAGLRRLDGLKARAIIWDEIQLERTRQDVKWGGADHDDQHNWHDWVAYLVRHTGKAVVWPFDLGTFRRQMVRVAALAVAAIEWADR